MRRAALILGLFCVSASLGPVALSAATDTASPAGALKIEAAVLSPHAAVKKTPPRSATPTLPAPRDPHPFITEFFGPAATPAPKPAVTPKKAVNQDPPRAALTPSAAE